MYNDILKIIVISLILYTPSVFALDVSEMEQLKPGTQLKVPVIDAGNERTENIKLDSIGVFVDSDGSSWYRLDGNFSGGQAITFFLEMSKLSRKADLVIRKLKLDDLGIQPKRIWKIDKEGEGEVEFDNKRYQYNKEESDDAKFTAGSPGATPRSMSYYGFNMLNDEKSSLLILEWGDDDFEIYQTRQMDLDKITLQ